MKQFIITPAAGKRLIAKAIANDPSIMEVAKSGTLVIVAGTTNAYVAQEVLSALHQAEGFSSKGFFRGITLPPSKPTTQTGRLPDETQFSGDVVISKGVWQKGKTIFDVVDDLKNGDIILKGANAVDLEKKRAAILIGHPKAGTIGAALPAVIGRKVKLIFPVGLEKRIVGNLDAIAEQMNHPDTRGVRFWPVPGKVITEIEAIAMLTGAQAILVAAGGVAGAEGCVWLLVAGNDARLEAASEIMQAAAKEPEFTV
jgi:hypothetical protein